MFNCLGMEVFGDQRFRGHERVRLNSFADLYAMPRHPKSKRLPTLNPKPYEETLIPKTLSPKSPTP